MKDRMKEIKNECKIIRKQEKKKKNSHKTNKKNNLKKKKEKKIRYNNININKIK